MPEETINLPALPAFGGTVFSHLVNTKILKSARGFKQYMCCRFNAFVMNVRIMTQKQLVQKVWMSLDGDDVIDYVIGSSRRSVVVLC